MEQLGQMQLAIIKFFGNTGTYLFSARASQPPSQNLSCTYCEEQNAPCFGNVYTLYATESQIRAEIHPLLHQMLKSITDPAF